MAEKKKACGRISDEARRDKRIQRMREAKGKAVGTHRRTLEEADWEDLTEQQKIFIVNYLNNGCVNATQAYIATGAESDHPSKQAYKLLNNPLVQKMLQAKLKERGEIADFTVDRVLTELKTLVCSNIGDFVDFVDGRIVYKDWSKIPKESLCAIQSIKEDQFGKISIKLYDKTSSIEKLAKIFCLDNIGKKVKLPKLPPLTNSENAMQYIQMVNEAVVNGQITVEQGSQMVDIARQYLKAIEVNDIENQLTELRDLVERRVGGNSTVNNYEERE